MGLRNVAFFFSFFLFLLCGGGGVVALLILYLTTVFKNVFVPDEFRDRGKNEKPRFDFANLARAVTEENDRQRTHNQSQDATIISHVVPHLKHPRYNRTPSKSPVYLINGGRWSLRVIYECMDAMPEWEGKKKD